MQVLKKKRNLAFMLTIVALATLWAALVFDTQNAFAKGAFAMVAVVLIGISIEKWSSFLKEYIRVEIEKNNSMK